MTLAVEDSDSIAREYVLLEWTISPFSCVMWKPKILMESPDILGTLNKKLGTWKPNLKFLDRPTFQTLHLQLTWMHKLQNPWIPTVLGEPSLRLRGKDMHPILLRVVVLGELDFSIRGFTFLIMIRKLHETSFCRLRLAGTWPDSASEFITRLWPCRHWRQAKHVTLDPGGEGDLR